MAKGNSAKTANGSALEFEAQLWAAADKMRGHMDASEYKHVCLGLIFLKYISDAFEEKREQLLFGFSDPKSEWFIKDAPQRTEAAENRDEYLAANVFWLPAEARWHTIQARAKSPEIGKVIDEAMIAIERENPTLKGVLLRDYARPSLDKVRLGGLVDIISNIGFNESAAKSKDVLGRVYEYFLGKFASAEGKGGGEFYTPQCVVQVLVAMLEPYKGRVFDPCCGSGGMFVSSEKFVEEHGGRVGDIAVYGQESNYTTWKLARMKLAIRGIDANLGPRNADSFRQDLHPDLKADFILANPPFNMSDWGGETLRADVRWKFRGAASDVVRVLPSAGSRGLDALVTPDGDFNLADLPTPNVREAIPTDSGCKLLIMDAARCWSRVGIPRGLDATARRLVLAPDGDSVTWQDQDASGRAVEVVARTRQWALREGYNFGRDAWLGIYDGWVPASLPKGDTMKEAICNFRLGSGTVGIARLNSVLTAPSFGKGGRLLLDDGVLEVGPGEVVFAALGPLHGRVRVDGDVEGAKARVRAFLKAFPFVDTTSESVALSLLFTLAARGAFPIPPGYAIDAPEYGSGKTYLAVAMAAVAGMGVSIIPCGSDAGTDEELAKRFETALMTGSSGMILLDDVPNGRMPNFSTLRTYLSAARPELKIRRFGKNDDQVTVRVDRSTLVVTGNAIDVSKDMIRRLLRCYLSQEEANEQTGWTIEAARETINGLFACPDKWGVLLSDILTILKHNWDERPCELPPTQNYEGWSRVVREAVKFTTGVDVDDSREEMSEFEDDRQLWQETMTRIREAVKDLEMFTVGDLVDAVKKVADAGFGAKEEGPVKELASEFEFSRKGAMDFARRIGNFMKMHKDRAFPADGGMRRLRRLPHKTKHKGEKTKWCFVEVRVKN